MDKWKNGRRSGQQKKDDTSSEASVQAGKDAIEAAKHTAPTEEEKKDSEQKKDAENWRNEG